MEFGLEILALYLFIGLLYVRGQWKQNRLLQQILRDRGIPNPKDHGGAAASGVASGHLMNSTATQPGPAKVDPWQIAGHMASRAWTLLPLAAATLLAGMLIYHWAEHLPWPDAFLNAAMLLGGMGPVDRLQTTTGKLLAGGYALFAGLVFIVLAGVMLGPVIHEVLHRFHLEGGGKLPGPQGPQRSAEQEQ